MKYVLLLWQHANVRYQKEAVRLALAEACVILSKTQPDAQVSEYSCFDMPALLIETAMPFNAFAIEAISTHSLFYGLFELNNECWKPISGRASALLGEDLPGILKYKGKTNEAFTAMALNMALYSGELWKKSNDRLDLLDPMCGKGTALYVAANRGYNATGADLDKNELAEAERFFKKYLEFHRIKHKLRRESLTIPNSSAPCASFQYQQHTEKNYSLRLVQMDARDVCKGFGKKSFHIIVCDLPYGVQHSSKGGGLESVLAKALPQWLECLKLGGSCAISFNAATFKTNKLRELMEAAGFKVICGGVYDNLSHWVEQAVTRDLVIGVRMGN